MAQRRQQTRGDETGTTLKVHGLPTPHDLIGQRQVLGRLSGILHPTGGLEADPVGSTSLITCNLVRTASRV